MWSILIRKNGHEMKRPQERLEYWFYDKIAP